MPTDPTPQAVSVCKHCERTITRELVWIDDDKDIYSSIVCAGREDGVGHEPSPASPAPVHDGSEHFYAENFGMSVGVPAPQAPSMPTTQGEIPERWKITYRQEGLSELARCIRQLGRAEWERDYWKQNAEYSARSGPHAETVVKLREERDRARDALRKADSTLSLIRHRGQSEPWTALMTISSLDQVIGMVRTALKPVSDRQPEGETK